MASEPQARIVREKLKPVLHGEGFVGPRSIFNRPAHDGLIHVVTLQLGQKSLTGSCTVNVGVYIPEVAAVFGYPKRGELWDEAFCEIRERIGMLMPDRRDHWWPFSKDPEGVAESLSLAVSRCALPFLARLDCRSNIIESWNTLESSTPPRRGLSLALLLAAANRRKEAFALIEAAQQSSEPHLPKLAERVRAHINTHETAV